MLPLSSRTFRDPVVQWTLNEGQSHGKRTEDSWRTVRLELQTTLPRRFFNKLGKFLSVSLDLLVILFVLICPVIKLNFTSLSWFWPTYLPKAQGAPGSKIVSIYIMHKNLNSIKFPSRAYRPKTLSDFLIYVVGISSGDLVSVEVWSLNTEYYVIFILIFLPLHKTEKKMNFWPIRFLFSVLSG